MGKKPKTGPRNREDKNWRKRRALSNAAAVIASPLVRKTLEKFLYCDVGWCRPHRLLFAYCKRRLFVFVVWTTLALFVKSGRVWKHRSVWGGLTSGIFSPSKRYYWYAINCVPFDSITTKTIVTNVPYGPHKGTEFEQMNESITFDVGREERAANIQSLERGCRDNVNIMSAINCMSKNILPSGEARHSFEVYKLLKKRQRI